MAKSDIIKYKKAPQAPRRFKSAYMFFSTNKHKEIRQGMDEKLQTTAVAKMVSEAWKNLSGEERKEWDEMAKRDKARYEVEKTMYTGPWKIPARKRARKDPSAPKRPMSAFLSFSNDKRALVKEQNPDMGHAEVSRVLAKMWKEAPEKERKEYIDREYELRQNYKCEIAQWRKTNDQKLEEARRKREDMAMRTAEALRRHSGFEAKDAMDQYRGPQGIVPSMGSAGGVPSDNNPVEANLHGPANGSTRRSNVAFSPFTAEPQQYAYHHDRYPNEQQQYHHHYDYHPGYQDHHPQRSCQERSYHVGDATASYTSVAAARTRSYGRDGADSSKSPAIDSEGYRMHNGMYEKILLDRTGEAGPFPPPGPGAIDAYAPHDETTGISASMESNPSCAVVLSMGSFFPLQDRHPVPHRYSGGCTPAAPAGYAETHGANCAYYANCYHPPQESISPPCQTTKTRNNFFERSPTPGNAVASSDKPETKPREYY